MPGGRQESLIEMPTGCERSEAEHAAAAAFQSHLAFELGIKRSLDLFFSFFKCQQL